jgi:hypothetical protein
MNAAADRQPLEAIPSPSDRFLGFDRQPRADLEAALLRGATPDLGELVGWEFRGMNTPGWARLAGIKKFIKGFEEREGGVYGYNRPVAQGGLEEPWTAKGDRFGFYRVDAVDPTARDNRYLHAVLLDYGLGGNGRFDPTQGLRDYLVQLDPTNPNLFLGKAYYALGPLRVGTSFFVLERLEQRGYDLPR